MKKGGSYTDSSQWLKNKKATINQKKRNKCIKFAITVGMHHHEICNNSHRVNDIRSLNKHYDWKGIKFPSGQKD